MPKTKRPTAKKLVATENPKVQQLWHCEKCGYETSHKMKNGTDKRGRGISRVHVCEECGNELKTIERRRSTSFDKVRMELRQARDSAKELVKALEGLRSSASNLLSSLEGATETLEKPEPYQSRPIPYKETGPMVVGRRAKMI